MLSAKMLRSKIKESKKMKKEDKLFRSSAKLLESKVEANIKSQNYMKLKR
jgi:hypothetical protein